jgi:hypothetical protein
MKEGVPRVTALRAGEVDFANYVPREHVERLSRDPQLGMSSTGVERRYASNSGHWQNSV